jgi:hypothetical protein
VGRVEGHVPGKQLALVGRVDVLKF